MPLKVERKLYSATLLVRLAISSDAVNFSRFSVWNRLSVPMPRLKTWRGFTRSGLWSSFSWPACGRVSSFDVTVPLHEVIGIAVRGEHTAAGQADRGLLRGGQRQRGVGIRHAADHQAAIVAPGKRYPFVGLVLIAEDSGGLERLVVVDAEHAAGQRRSLGDQPAHFRREIARARVAEGPVGLEAVHVGGAQAAGDAIELGVVPGDRKRQGGVQQRAEVVRAVGVLPEVIGVEQQIPADGLLQAGVELVAVAGLDGHRIGAEHVLAPARPRRWRWRAAGSR